MPRQSTSKKKGRSAGGAAANKNDFQRAEILRAAATLFARKGYGGTKLHEIAEAVGLTRTAFYYYFASKEQLLTALVEDVTFTLQRRSAGVAERDDIAAPDMLRKVVSNYANQILEHSVEFRFVSRTEFELPAAMAASHDRAKRQLLDSFITIIQRGIKSGHFNVADARMASLAVIGMCNWGAWWFRAGGTVKSSDIADMLADFALRIVKAESSPRSKTERLRHEVDGLREGLVEIERLIFGSD